MSQYHMSQVHQHGDNEAALDDWRQRMRAERKARGEPWTPEVGRESDMVQ